MIQFGTWSIVLLLGSVQGLVVSAGLLLRPVNRSANVFLAGLIFLLSLKAVPYIIGYAGFYMAYPWLDLAPFDLSLGFGPLLYLYVVRLTVGRLPKRYALHLLPLALQFLIYAALFCQPLEFKHNFENTVGPSFNTTDNLLNSASFCVYIVLAWTSVRRYERLLSNRFANPEGHRLKPLYFNLAIVSVTFLAFVGAKLWTTFIRSLSYYQMFPFYLLLMGVVYAFGFVAFQFSQVEYPLPTGSTEQKDIDWAALASHYASELEQQNFWRDPLLSLAAAAAALGTTETRLSKAINLGTGVSFSTWINRYRIKEVTKELTRSPGSEAVFEIAQRCGFNSKASFNRWFRAEMGCTPTEYRLSRSSPSLVPEPRPAQPQGPPAKDRL